MLLNEMQRCLLWLSTAEVSAAHVQALIEQYHTPMDIWESFGTSAGPSFRTHAKSVLKSFHSDNALDGLVEKLEKKNVRLLFEDDPHYPLLLKNIQDPPYLLYYAGKISCLQKSAVAIVGTRRPSTYGTEMAGMLARGLSEAGVCVVSGLARGIDGAAHEAVLHSGGSTIGVLGSGINVPYPPEHTPLLRGIAGGNGLILSEFPLDSPPKPFHFPHRNRILSGLSLATVFVEGRIQSGGMLTVNAALSQGREVFAVPGRVGTAGAEGPNAILREGARIVTSAQDLLEDLGLGMPNSSMELSNSNSSFNDLQSRIVSLLQVESLMPAELADRLKENIPDVVTELGTLEIMGVISREAGNRFYLPLSAGK